MSADMAVSLVAAGLTAPPLRAAAAPGAAEDPGPVGVQLAAELRPGSLPGTYGLVTGAWVLVAGEGAFALGSLTVLSRLLGVTTAARWATGCTLLVGSAYTVLGPGPCLLAATVASMTARLGQIRACVRSGTAAGVSGSTWLLLAVVGTCLAVSARS